MRSMTKASFNINTDPDTNRRYVTKTENCPVASFTKYISKLDPTQNRLWYYAKDSYNTEDDNWYTNNSVGTHTFTIPILT